jgi:hypothetical protein
MATIKISPRADGTPTYRVMWRQGGTRDGSWESETPSCERPRPPGSVATSTPRVRTGPTGG